MKRCVAVSCGHAEAYPQYSSPLDEEGGWAGVGVEVGVGEGVGVGCGVGAGVGGLIIVGAGAKQVLLF